MPIKWFSIIISIVIVAFFFWFYEQNKKSKRRLYIDNTVKGRTIDNPKELQRIVSELSDSGNCIFNTSVNDSFKSIKVITRFPCYWNDYSDNIGIIPSLLKQLKFDSGYDNIGGCSISIGTPKIYLTQSVIEKVRSEANLRKTVNGNGEYISSKKIIINNVKGDELITSKKIESGYMYSLETHFYYKNHIITILYMVAGYDKQSVSYSFGTKKDFFRMLYSKTEFL